MKKIALITHSFHSITQSAPTYINEIFANKEKFKVDIYFNEEWGSQEQYKIFDHEIEGYDVVIILQLISISLLNKIKDKNIVFMPMYDYARNFDIKKWLPALGLKILSPCKGMSQTLENLGLDFHEIRYFPEVDNYNSQNYKKVFFWNRVESINYKLVLCLLENYQFDNLNIHQTIDPGENPIVPSSKIIKEKNISFSSWFDSKNDYLEMLSEYGIYIAPRPYEGGGLASFMDALKLGKIVIAPNNSPYADYITHNVNGILYNLNNPEPINFNEIDLNKMSNNAYESIKSGRKVWIDSLENIHKYIFDERIDLINLKFKDLLVQELNNRWYRFGKINNLEKIKVVFRYINKNLFKV